MGKVNIGIVGATGMVGRAFLKVLDEQGIDIGELYLFGSSRSANTKVEFKGKLHTVEELTEDSFDREMDIALFSAGGDVSKKFAPIAAKKGIKVVDNSSAWRMDKEVPLVVPEVNPEDINWDSNIIANPNCSTIQCVLPLKVLHDNFKIKRIVYSTYQAVSGSGVAGVEDLERGLNGAETLNYVHQIAFNCLPQIDDFLDNGYTKEEIKMIEETKKILNNQDLKITATTVRVPVIHGHSVSINLEFEKEFDLEKVYEVLNNANGVVVQDDIKNNIYPMPVDIEGKDEVYVGRIRRDFSIDNGLNLWVVADNIRKGAATNTVQIAKLLIETMELAQIL